RQARLLNAVIRDIDQVDQRGLVEVVKAVAQTVIDNNRIRAAARDVEPNRVRAVRVHLAVERALRVLHEILHLGLERLQERTLAVLGLRDDRTTERQPRVEIPRGRRGASERLLAGRGKRFIFTATVTSRVVPSRMQRDNELATSRNVLHALLDELEQRGGVVQHLTNRRTSSVDAVTAY